MPRIQPPQGYYSAKKVKEILNISDAMIRYYVQKEKIKYLLPPGRKQGFYLKKDVDQLANELTAFLSIEENIPSKFVRATKEDLPEITKIGKALFAPGESGNNTTRPSWRNLVFEKNPETQYALKHDGEIIGFASILPFRPDTDKIEKLLRSDVVSDANITANDIETFEPDKRIHLYIGAIGIKPDISRDKRRHYGATLVSGLINTLVDLGRRGIIIETITAGGATPMGIRLLQNFGLHEIPARVPGKRAFTMNVEESGSPVSVQYKEALEESRILDKTSHQPHKR